MRKGVFVAVLLAPLLIGADQGGCDQPLPTIAQIEYTLPASLRNCPTKPRSPGRNATQRQTAAYIVALNAAFDRCNVTIEDRNRLYDAYRAELAKTRGA